MDVFALREQLVTDYGRYAESFLAIRDERIRAHVAERLEAGVLWPDPPLQLNPSYEPGGTVDELVAEGLPPMARPGLEPGTPRFSVVCSTN